MCGLQFPNHRRLMGTNTRKFVVCFLMGNSMAYELPRRKHTTFRTRKSLFIFITFSYYLQFFILFVLVLLYS